MADYAHVLLAHWRAAGTDVHQQRGEWMLARVHTMMGESGAALKHTKRCLELSEQHKAELKDFDFAFAYEGIARAHALAGSRAEALKYIALAQKAGEAIAGEEDRKVFFGDFNGGNWYGVM